jgi:hypothetical protein
MSKELILTKGKVAIVDDDDFEWLNQWKWSLHSQGYAVRREYLGVLNGREKSNYILLHRLITGVGLGQEVDHINHNRLDNRRTNLRICNRFENASNISIRKDNTSRYKNVYWYKPYKKWKVSITAKGREHHLGYFEDKKDAVKARDKAIVELHGEFANVNL